MTTTDKIIFILIGLLIGLCFGIYAGATISTNHAERYRTESIDNAVTHALESCNTQLSCKDSEIMSIIKGLAMNDVHVNGIKMWITTSDGAVSENDRAVPE